MFDFAVHLFFSRVSLEYDQTSVFLLFSCILFHLGLQWFRYGKILTLSICVSVSWKMFISNTTVNCLTYYNCTWFFEILICLRRRNQQRMDLQEGLFFLSSCRICGMFFIVPFSTNSFSKINATLVTFFSFCVSNCRLFYITKEILKNWWKGKWITLLWMGMEMDLNLRVFCLCLCFDADFKETVWKLLHCSTLRHETRNARES